MTIPHGKTAVFYCGTGQVEAGAERPVARLILLVTPRSKPEAPARGAGRSPKRQRGRSPKRQRGGSTSPQRLRSATWSNGCEWLPAGSSLTRRASTLLATRGKLCPATPGQGVARVIRSPLLELIKTVRGSQRLCTPLDHRVERVVNLSPPLPHRAPSPPGPRRSALPCGTRDRRSGRDACTAPTFRPSVEVARDPSAPRGPAAPAPAAPPPAGRSCACSRTRCSSGTAPRPAAAPAPAVTDSAPQHHPRRAVFPVCSGFRFRRVTATLLLLLLLQGAAQDR